MASPGGCEWSSVLAGFSRELDPKAFRLFVFLLLEFTSTLRVCIMDLSLVLLYPSTLLEAAMGLGGQNIRLYSSQDHIGGRCPSITIEGVLGRRISI